MTCTVAPERLDDLYDEWLALLSTQRARRVFQHPRWQQVWLKEFGREQDALFLAAREDGRLIGLASLLGDGDSVSFLGDHNICDYMDFVVAPGRESEVLPAILDALLEQGKQNIELWGLRADSPSKALLPQLAEERGLDLRFEEEAVCPNVGLPPLWDEYLDSLGKKNRHELRRKIRRLSKTVGEPELRMLCSPAEVEGGMDEFLRLMTLHSDKAQFMTPTMERFFRRAGVAMAAEALIGLYLFEADGRVVASTLCFEDEEELLIYNSGYDPQYAYLSVGLLSKAACLRRAIEQGKKRVDFLRGSEPYKYDLGGRDLQVYRCLIAKA